MEIYSGSYSDGQEAGQKLLRLFDELGVSLSSKLPASENELEKVFELIRLPRTKNGNPVMKGFLSTVLRKDYYNAEIIEVLGASTFIEDQTDCSPLSELAADSGLVQFASWTGDYSDGDAWCLDILEDRVVCIPVGVPETRAEALERAYGIFPDFLYLEAYLRCSAEIRGWLPK
ncbi:hypothetical protein [Roseibacillus persicicus]|uniref:Uncharacterized protein n=1 Tax=Roseibacillus persicicus TaxID=454148 RepID=A0A918TYA1_9BACT|nr:hypothetical protein [Roseibacillus persicicus]GHC65649.1 hypothetical protein GCM10007100_36850 [Roseibacillus persicicus]